MRGDDAAAAEGEEQLFHRRADDGDPPDAVTPASSDDENLLAPLHLLLADPPFGASDGFSRGGKTFSKVERALWPEAQLVGRDHRHGRYAAASNSSAASRKGLAKQVSLHANRRAQPMQSRRIFSGNLARSTRT